MIVQTAENDEKNKSRIKWTLSRRKKKEEKKRALSSTMPPNGTVGPRVGEAMVSSRYLALGPPSLADDSNEGGTSIQNLVSSPSLPPYMPSSSSPTLPKSPNSLKDLLSPVPRNPAQMSPDRLTSSSSASSTTAASDPSDAIRIDHRRSHSVAEAPEGFEISGRESSSDSLSESDYYLTSNESCTSGSIVIHLLVCFSSYC